MSDEDKTDDAASAASNQAAAASDGENPARAAPPQRPGRAGTVVLWLLVIALAAGAWLWHQRIYRPQADAMAARVTETEARLQAVGAETAAAVAEAGTELASANAELAGQIDGIAGQTEDLKNSVKALYARQAEESLDWVLAEVEYLVLAASQRLALERDVETALAALRAADKRLRAAEHPELIDLRAALTADPSALEAVARPDVEGLALYLAEAVTRVEKLPTRPIAEIDMPLTRLSEPQMAAEDWRGMMQALWADLTSLVEIKDGELEDGVLFDPELRYFLRQNLRLELASARLALLQRDTANYRASVTLVMNLLDSYYDAQAGAVAGLRRRLEETLPLELDPAVPDVTASLDAVRAKREAVRDAAIAGN